MKNLRDAVMTARVSKTAIAERAGVNRKTVTRLLQKDDVSMGTYFAIAKAVGANPMVLLGEANRQADALIEEKKKDAAATASNTPGSEVVTRD